MKIEGMRDQILDALIIADKVSGSNLTLPVLNCVFLSTTNKKLTVRATNLDLGVELTVPVKVEEDGVIAVPSHTLHNTLTSLYEGKSVTLQTKEGNLLVKTPSSVSTIKAQPHEDFPNIPRIKSTQTLALKADLFVNGLRSVWYSASLSSIKPELSSIYLYQKDKKFCFVATDSFRLAEKTIPIQKRINFDFEPVLIPLKNIPELIRTLDKAEDEIDIVITQNQISFSFNSVYITSRLIDGAFPDYQQILPKETETEAVVLKQDFLNALKKTIIFSDSFNQVKFSLHPGKKTFSISSKNNDVGETEDFIHAALSGKDLEINFNHKYLTDCFQAINSDSISLSFAGFSRPLVVRGTSDSSFLYLVMPMNR